MGYVVEHVSNDEFNAEMVCKDGKVMFFHTPSRYTMIKIQNYPHFRGIAQKGFNSCNSSRLITDTFATNCGSVWCMLFLGSSVPQSEVCTLHLHWSHKSPSNLH